MDYVIMEKMYDGDVRYRIGIENDYELVNGEIILKGTPQIYYREVLGNLKYTNGRPLDIENFQTDDKQILKDIDTFKKVLSDLINNENYNKEVYNHFFVEMDDYPEDIYDGIYYEFN